MRSGRPGRACMVALVALTAPLLSACSHHKAPPATHTIGILRTVPGGSTQNVLLDSLAAEGIDRAHLRIFGENLKEVHTDEVEIEATVRSWVRKGAELIVALPTRTAAAAAKASPGTPIIVLSTDPSATGLVKDERHPEANITGASYRVPADRTLALANEAFADVDIKRVGCLDPTGDPAAAPARAALEHGAAALGTTFICTTFATPEGIPDAVRQLLDEHVDVIVLVNAPATAIALPQLRFVLSKTMVPVIANQPADVAVLTLSPDAEAVYRTMGRQAARILEGTRVRDVPVEDPARYLLVVNLPAAARIGRTISPSVIN